MHSTGLSEQAKKVCTLLARLQEFYYPNSLPEHSKHRVRSSFPVFQKNCVCANVFYPLLKNRYSTDCKPATTEISSTTIANIYLFSQDQLPPLCSDAARLCHSHFK